MNIRMNFNVIGNRCLKLVFLLMLILFCIELQAETIYQWSDPWGQIQYSKTPVSGASVSDLTELPPQKKLTARQKQEAMLQKMRQINQENSFRKNKQAYKKQIQFQKRQSDEHCRQLRSLLTDIQVRNNRQYYWEPYYYPGSLYYWDRYTPERYPEPYYYQDQFMEQDLQREIRNYCR